MLFKSINDLKTEIKINKYKNDNFNRKSLLVEVLGNFNTGKTFI